MMKRPVAEPVEAMKAANYKWLITNDKLEPVTRSQFVLFIIFIAWVPAAFAQPAANALAYDSARVIIPEEYPGFRARSTTEKIESDDYNFDGYMDYRLSTFKYATKKEYFLYDPDLKKYTRDSLLSRFDQVDYLKKDRLLWGIINTQIGELSQQTDCYTYRNGVLAEIRRSVCNHTFPHSERIDCTTYIWENGEFVFEEFIRGAE